MALALVVALAVEAAVERCRIRHLPLKLPISDPYRSYRIACHIRSGALRPYQEEVFCHIDQRVAGQTDRPGLRFLVLPLSPWRSYLSAPDSLRHLLYDCLLEHVEGRLVGRSDPAPFLVDTVADRRSVAESEVVSLVAENAPPPH